MEKTKVTNGRRMIRFVWVVCVMVSGWLAAPAASGGEVYTSLFSDKAVGGYDPVSFFEGRPAKGRSDIPFRHKGAVWLFASEKNRAAFQADPERYEPQYGGHCAWAAAQGERAPGDPAYWRIVDGRLYLNYSAKVQRDWEVDIPGFIGKADALWSRLRVE